MRIDSNTQVKCDKCGTVNDMTYTNKSIGRLKCYKCGHVEEWEPSSKMMRRIADEQQAKKHAENPDR